MLRAPRFHLDRLPPTFFHAHGESIWRRLAPSFQDLRRGALPPWSLASEAVRVVLETLEKPLWRGVPGPAREALDHWKGHPSTLLFTEEPPAPWDVLELQCGGRRCVTLFTDELSWREPATREKDPIAFLIHDLVHAHRFLLGPVPLADQVAAARACLLARKAGLLARLEFSQEDREGLDYAIADMNTHPAHQLKVLTALELRRLKRADRVDDSERLSPSSESAFQEWQRELASCFGACAAGEGLRADQAQQSLDVADEVIVHPAAIP